MDLDMLRSPIDFLNHALGSIPADTVRDVLRVDEVWWKQEGEAISESVDRMGTPWLRMFDEAGLRVDRILFAPDYWRMLRRGYRAGVVWRAFEEESLIPTDLLLYSNSFHDPGICCPYTVSLATALSVHKYGTPELQARFLSRLLRKDDTVWQGATWMTEIKGGSDLGASVESTARRAGTVFLLNGEKYFASNVGAELAVVVARLEGAPKGVRGLSLFLLPRHRAHGELNYFVRRLKNKIATRSVPTGEVELRDSEAYLLGSADQGIFPILEVLNVSRVANSLVSVAVAQRAIADALAFADGRVAFGKRIIDHPLLRRQFEDRTSQLHSALALAWNAVELLNEVWREVPPYSERYHLFRLVAHLAKYWTAELAMQTAKWGMEVHGGIGVLGEYSAERWLREAMILAIWEGTSHRQMLDALEVMERKGAHHMLFKRLAATASAEELQELKSYVESHLRQPAEKKEAEAEALFKRLASFAANKFKASLPRIRAAKS